MLSSGGKAGYNRKISEFIINSLHENHSENETIDLQLDDQIASKYAIALQTAWRRRQARIMVSNLKQESNCKKYRSLHPIGNDNGQFLIPHCDACLNGQEEAERREKLSHQKYTEIDRLLFEGQKRLFVTDRGDNWNQRFQTIVSLPENTDLERSIKYAELYTLNHDFVSTAKTYAQTIISEFFLHHKDKSIHAKKMGGIAGGEKYLWRGILFKMATGTSGPYNGSDEAAAKAAGHDLKGSVHYYNSGVRELCLPLMAVIDYKGFRMTAQALLPLGEKSLVYGSSDAGRTVHNSNEKFNAAMELAAKSLNLRKHAVGELTQVKELHSAVDVEGHVGLDNRMYLLDLARTFPPEAPSSTKHLNDVYGDGTIVLIKTQDPTNPSNFIFTKGSVHRAYPHGSFYDILFEDGSVGFKIPSTKIQSKSLSIFWRLLRPEYVRTRGTRLTPLKQEDINPINSAVALAHSMKFSTSGSMSPLHIESVEMKGPKSSAMRFMETESSLPRPLSSIPSQPTHSPVVPVAATAPPPQQLTPVADYDSFEPTPQPPPSHPSQVKQESMDDLDYDTFDSETKSPDPPMPPVPKLGVMRQQTLGYDEEDSPVRPPMGVMRQQTLGYDELESPVGRPMGVLRQQTLGYDDFDQLPSSPGLNDLPTADYDTFDLVATADTNYDNFDETTIDEKPQQVQQHPPVSVQAPPISPAKGPSLSQDRSPSSGNSADGYGYFRNTISDDSPTNPLLSSSPSNLRMKANQNFESNQMEEIINLLDRYRKYDLQEVVGVEAGTQHSPEVLSRQEELRLRQAYIDATVSDLYQASPDDTSSTASPTKAPIPISASTSPLSTPLSPDALTAFSKYDPEAVDRNREVIRATDRLIQEVVPSLAHRLASMRHEELAKLDLSVFFHSNGVNIRHMGLVRSHIPGSQEHVGVRTFLLLNIVCRTLKNIAREFQRRWMKSEQSSSEQGIFFLLTQFLNLMVGQHTNSDKFWSERVIVGVFQRFGKCALDGNDAHLQGIRKSPTFLTKMVETFLQMINMKLKPAVYSQFMKDQDPYRFEFMVEDIESLEPKVKYMHIVDYVSGVMLQDQAASRAAAGDDIRTITRLRHLAEERFSHAERAMPLHNETCKRSDVIRLLNAEQEERDAAAAQSPSKCKFF